MGRTTTMTTTMTTTRTTTRAATKKTMTTAAVLLLLVGAGAATAAGGGTGEPAAPRPGGFSGRGMLRPEAEISLSSRAAGSVTSIPLIDGDAAGTGDAVVILDDAEEELRSVLARTEMEAAELTLKKVKGGARPEDLERAKALLAEAHAGLQLAEKSLTSDLKLAEGGFLSELGRQRSERALEAARAQTESRRLDLVILEKGARPEDVRLAEIEVERKKANLAAALRDQGRRRISSSRPGRALVSRIWVEPGQWVEAGRTLADLVYIDRLRIEIDIPGPSAISLPRGAKAQVRSPAFPGVVLDGLVERVSPVVDPASGTVRVLVAAENPGHRVRPGVEAEVEIAP